MERGLDIDEAIDVVSRTCAYTNHTILVEALEKWPIGYLKKVVPQLVPIIEILDDKVRRRFSDESTAIIDRNDTVHMAHIDIHYGFKQFDKFRGIFFILVFDCFIKQRRKTRVAVKKPSAERNPVCFIIEFIRIDFIKIIQFRLF